MRKIALFLIAFLSLPLAAQAQFTNVTGTVKDLNGVLYACGTISAQLVVPGGVAPTLNGAGFTTQTSPVQLGCPTSAGTGASGTFLMRLADNNVVTPSGTQWKFTVNGNGGPPPLGTGPQTCTATLTITGSSQDISPSFSTCPALGTGGSSSSGTGNIIGGTALPIGTDSGVANAYVATVAFPSGYGATISGSQFTMKVSNSNTAASTINVNGSGAVAILTMNGTALSGGEMIAGNAYTFIFLGSATWVLAGSTGGATGLTSNQVSAQMVGPPGINGTTSASQAPLELFTPQSTSTAPTYRPMIAITCFGTGASGCTSIPHLFFGYDADGVAIIQAASGGALIGNWETFSPFSIIGLQAGNFNNVGTYGEQSTATDLANVGAGSGEIGGGFGTGIYQHTLNSRLNGTNSHIMMQGEMGTLTFSASTTASITYATLGHSFTNTPLVFFSGVNPGAVTFTLTTTTNTGFTLTASASNSLTVNWIAVGNPN